MSDKKLEIIEDLVNEFEVNDYYSHIDNCFFNDETDWLEMKDLRRLYDLLKVFLDEIKANL